MNDQGSIFGTNKILRYADRIAAWQRGQVVAPVTCEFDLTAVCNHRCPDCGGGRYRGAMRTEEAKDWLRQLADYGCCGVMFTGGGEPLMHRDAPELIETASKLGMKVGLITNGGLVTPEIAARLVAVCSWVRVSIDASDPDLYALTHGMGPDDFERAWDAVDRLAHAKQTSGSRCTVGVSYMVDERTRRGMLHAATLAQDCGADYLQFRPFWGRAVPIDAELAICRQRETERFRVLSACQKYRRLGCDRGYATCHGAGFNAVIQADGSMPLCCNLRGRPEWYLGNLLLGTLKAIWEGPARRILLGRLDVAKCVPLCRNDAINLVLADAFRPKQHEEFL